MNESSPTTPAEWMAQSLVLKNGTRIKNRLGKSAMSEALGTTNNRPTGALVTLYRTWADGGVGVCITGNVMIDGRALGEPNNVVVEDESELPLLTKWAEGGTQNDTQLWMQINHPGKQVPKGLNAESVSPSAVPFAKGLSRYFETPRELTETEIEEIIERFGRTAAIAKKAGFTGVQIHGAHGYLVSQFLSPHHNRRGDTWGGTAEKRRRFVEQVYRTIRTEVGSDFPVSIKLNSADFQRGGFTEEESLDVIESLVDLGIDLVEISGGTYEAPAMSGAKRNAEPVRESTKQREAYFLSFAEAVRERVTTTLMVTGGFRSPEGISSALELGALDVAGLARPLALDPEFPNKLLAGEELTSPVKPIRTGIAAVDRMALMEVAYYARQIRRMGNGEPPRPNESALVAFLMVAISSGVGTFRTRRLRA